MNANITQAERQLLITYVKDPYVRDFGWHHKEAGAWINVLSDEMQSQHINKHQFSGIFSSLVKKGVISSNGEDCCLTPMGMEIILTEGIDEEAGIDSLTETQLRDKARRIMHDYKKPGE